MPSAAGDVMTSTTALPPPSTPRAVPPPLGLWSGVSVVFWLRWREMFGKHRVLAATLCGLWVVLSFGMGVLVGAFGVDGPQVALTSGSVDPIELILFSTSAAWLLWVFGPVFGLAGVDVDEQRLSPYPVPRPVLSMSRLVGILLDVPTLTLAPPLIGVCAGAAGVPGLVAGLALTVSGVAAGVAIAGASHRVRRASTLLGVLVVGGAAVVVSSSGWEALRPPPVDWLGRVVVDGQWQWTLVLLLLAAVAMVASWFAGEPTPVTSQKVRSRRFPSSPASAATSALLLSVVRSRSWRLASLTPIVGVMLIKISATAEVSPTSVAALFAVSAAATGPLNLFSYVGPGVALLARMLPAAVVARAGVVVASAAIAVPTLVSWVAATAAGTGPGDAVWVQLVMVASMVVSIGSLAAWWSWRHPEPVDHASMRARPASFAPTLLFIVVASVMAVALNSLPWPAAVLVASLLTVVWLLRAQREAPVYVQQMVDTLAR